MAKVTITLEDTPDGVAVHADLTREAYNPEFGSHYFAVVALGEINKAAAAMAASESMEAFDAQNDGAPVGGN